MDNIAIKRPTLIIATLSSFMTPFMGSSINIALPSIEKAFQIDAVLEIRPPRDGQIQFAKIRNILYVLRDQLGLNIQWVSYDSYQSVDSLQILRTKGFDAYNQSVDKTRLPYEFVKSALTDRRIAIPDHAKLREELVRLNDEPATGKIDHPPNGSKDCADAFGIEATAGPTLF